MSKENVYINNPDSFKPHAEIETNEVELRETSHTGHCYIINASGQNLKKVYIKHTVQKINNTIVNEKTYNDIKNAGSTAEPLVFTYITGVGSPFDYWFIDIEVEAGYKYKTKDNFYCSVSSDDNGIVVITISSNLIAHFNFSSSSGCDIDLLGPY